MTEADRSPDDASRTAELIPLIRRVVGARVSEPAAAQDAVQETLARLVPVEHRLDASALAPYAVVTALNVVRGLARSQERELRHGHRMLDPRQPDDPELHALKDEERRALAAALERLSPAERDSLLAHDVEGVPTAVLAERLETTPGAVATRLARARARLRVEYLLTLRRVELPTSACKPVLLAISAGDKRQQRTLGAGEHLVACASCAGLSEPLVRRRRPLAAIGAMLGLGRLYRWLRRTVRAHPAPSAAAGVATVGVAVWAAVALWGGQPQPALFVQAGSSIPLSGDKPMAPYAGNTVEARGAPVQSVVGTDGFWVGASRAQRVWVDVVGDPSTLAQLRAGAHVSFQGTLVANTAEALERAGGGGPGDRAQLESQGYHVDVQGDSIQAAAARR